MERLNLHMALEMAREFDIAVVGPEGCRHFLPPQMEVREVPATPLWQFLWGALRQCLSMARSFRPDIVLAGSGLAAPFAWCAARLAGARLIVYVHGLDLIADYRIYRWFWLPFIRRADLCIANSQHTARLAGSIGVPNSHVVILHPGVELPAEAMAPADFRARFNLGERPLLLSVGRVIARKGLLEFVEYALPQIAAEVPTVCLLIVGEEVPRLLHGTSVGLTERIRERAAALDIAQHVLFLGPQDDATLADAYRAAAVHVFPVLEVPNDVEGFGMVAVEAAAHGLPTVAFAVGGVPDAVADGVSGSLIPPADYLQLARAVVERLRSPADGNVRSSARAFAWQFAWNRFGEKLRGLLRERTIEASASQ